MNNETLDILMYKYRIPYYVIHKHVIPYTYLPQSKILLHNIRNYKQDINLIEDIYLTQYNEFILLVDLLGFYNYYMNTKNINERLQALLKRHIMLKNKDVIELNQIMISCIKPSMRKRSVKLIWGLMMPEERNTFINDYVLDTMTILEN